MVATTWLVAGSMRETVASFSLRTQTASPAKTSLYWRALWQWPMALTL